MGSMVGHVGPGLGFFLIGLWHLLNHINLHSRNPNTFLSRPWFPSSFLSRHLELYLVGAGSCLSIAMELFIGPANHQPLDPTDLSIPSNHLQYFEHSSISLAFLAYAAFAVLLDRFVWASDDVAQLLAAGAFSQQLLMFHLHSADHMGVEGQYHWLLQLVIFVSLLTTLMGIGPVGRTSFPVALVRSVSVLFQGVWLAVMGVGLWTPRMIPKGCFLNDEEGHLVVRCSSSDEALHRAKSLVNIQFSWFFVGTVVGVMGLYLVVAKRCGYVEQEYVSLSKSTAASTSGDDDDDRPEDDLELQRSKVGEAQSFVRGVGR